MQAAIGCEPLTKEEHVAYCRAVEAMVHAAQAALVPLEAAVERLA